jgi:predicted Zn-dependent peptidase
MYQQTILPNQVTFVSYALPYTNSVSINLLVKVGSRYENVLTSGMSHFLEHMAFKGTKRRSAKQIAEEFDNIGGSFNAYTSKEFTVYHAKALQEDYYLALDIILDIVQNSIFDNQDIKKELSVIEQEINGVQDNPDELTYEMLHSNAFGASHPFGKSILGSYDSISKFESQDFADYVTNHYHNSNIIISVVGNVDHNKLAQEILSLWTKSDEAKVNKFEAASYHSGLTLTHKPLEQSTLMLGFQSVNYTTLKEHYLTQLLSIILGGGLSSRLFQNIREKLGLAYSIGSFNSAYADLGLFTIYASCAHNQVLTLISSIAREIHSLLEDINDAEINRAKAQIKANIKMAEEKGSYLAEYIAKSFAINGGYVDHEYILNNYILNVNQEELMQQARKIFATDVNVAFVGDKSVKLDYNEIYNQLKL